MSVIEIAVKGQEATSYELLITVANAASTVSAIIATQLLTPTKSVACVDDDTTTCGSSVVNTDSVDTYYASDGPFRFTYYTLLLTGIAITAAIIFVPFLPKSIDECHEWKDRYASTGTRTYIGMLSLFITVIVVAYGVMGAILLLDPQTSCLEFIGGSGCQ